MSTAEKYLKPEVINQIKRLDLRAQVVGHGCTMRLVSIEQLISERSARRVEDHCDACRRFVLHEFVQHVEHAEHGAGWLAFRIGERRQRMKCAIQIGRAVDQKQFTGCHMNTLIYRPLRLRRRRGTGLRFARCSRIGRRGIRR